MKKVICSLLLITLLATAGSVLAQRAPYWVKGEVVSIDQGPENSTVGIKLSNGEIYRAAANNELLKGIQVGNSISVEIIRGWAEVVEKTDAGADAGAQEKSKPTRGPQWIVGEVVSIDQGPENSTVGIKMYNGEIFTVAGKNDKFQNVKVGDRITVKTLKGWAKSVTRN